MKRWISDYGILLVLLALGTFFSVATWGEQYPEGKAAARQVAERLKTSCSPGARVLIVARVDKQEQAFADALEAALADSGLEVARNVQGTPADARRAMAEIVQAGGRIDAIAATQATLEWPIFEDLGERMPALANTLLVAPESYRWPSFLMAGNLLNVAHAIAVIAIIAIGMTMVIITGGIDLSVGSLVALASVVAAFLMERFAGAQDASVTAMIACSLAAIVLCALVGLFSGVMITRFDIPPFIVTLATMMVGSGLAYLLAKGQSIEGVPAAFQWLGVGADLGGLPNSVVLMIALYVAAHVLMSRMAIGRYIYAVGGNREAARLSGVPVAAILVLVYTLCVALAGLGGIITASQLKSGSPTYGTMYELSVIAAVVVGGTSLSGGEGKILGTLIGALIIAVIQNGMNLTGVGSYTQKIVLGVVLLGAVLADTLKRKAFARR